MSHLKGCPFCGEQPKWLFMNLVLSLVIWKAGFHIECNKCGAEGPKKITKQRAVESWNTRSCGGGRAE